jgi:asparagine synthase (glutamine-hydrolysing)
MCGIICGQGNINNPIRGLDTLFHRGPDQSDMIRFDNIFLGHTRLSIVDLQDGNQPLINENNTIFAVVNGEFYDYEPLREKLIAEGHYFKTHSDSEVLIHLYEQYGIECLQFLHGEFAFALYDKNLKRWFCARDRMGIRPLQYYFKNQKFIISSEAKAIFSLDINPEFNRENFWFSQHLQYLPQNGTLFKNIEMIKPAHFILIQNNQLSEHCYWSLNNIETKSMSFNEAKEQSIYLINQAVEKRVPKEVKWTSHLSGGIDSSIVSSLSQQYQDNGTCFTVQFTDDGFYDESVLAQETANFINAKLIKIPVTFSDMLKTLPDSIYHAEGLSINGHLGAKYLLNKSIKEHGFKVAMSGEGADEIFMGYSHLKQDYLSLNSLNNVEKQYLNGVQLPDGPTLDLSCIQQQWGFIPTWISAKSSMANKFSHLWHENFKFEANPYEQLINEFDFSSTQSSLKTSSQSWMKYCLSGYILKVLDDAQAMAHSVEGRLPFLDTQLMEFMWSVPDNLFFIDNIEKGLLRKGFNNIVPANVINKTKQSFMAPPLHWGLKNSKNKEFIYHYLLENKFFINQHLFCPKKIEQFLLQATIESNPSLEPILMTLLTTSIFCENFSL